MEQPHKQHNEQYWIAGETESELHEVGVNCTNSPSLTWKKENQEAWETGKTETTLKENSVTAFNEWTMGQAVGKACCRFYSKASSHFLTFVPNHFLICIKASPWLPPTATALVPCSQSWISSRSYRAFLYKTIGFQLGGPLYMRLKPLSSGNEPSRQVFLSKPSLDISCHHSITF